MLVLFVTLVSSQISFTYECKDQLTNFYANLGLSSSIPTLPVIDITPIPGNNGADLTFRFESVARTYQASIPGLSGAPLPIIEYVSFSYPWCVTGIQVMCGGELRQNLPKTWACGILDYDYGGNSMEGGRLFITRNASCDTLRVRLLGALTLPLANTLGALYTYSITGLPPSSGKNLTLSEALSEYQSSWCFDSYGNTTLPAQQHQLVCDGQQLRCQVSPRPSDAGSNRPFTPLPTWACRGNITPGGVPVSVWYINGYDLPFGAREATVGVQFCARYDTTCIDPIQTLTIESGMRQQLISRFDSLDSVLVLTFNGTKVHYDAGYQRSLEPFIRDVPCVCGLSVLCAPDGTIGGTGGFFKILNPSNILPVAIAGSNFSILLNTPSVILNASDSFDKDRAPNTLSYYWKVHNTTPSAVTIECVTCAVTRVTGPFVKGKYAFIFYASDDQDVTHDVIGFLADDNIIHAILPPDFDAQFELVTQCPQFDTQGYPLLGDNFTAIILNGSQSYNENPGFPIFYEWTQTTGNDISLTMPIVCDPATVDYLNFEAFWRRNESASIFVPSTLGIYCFRLTVNDGTGERFAYEEMCVSVEDNFDTPNATDRNYTDYPNLPGYNHSDPSVPTINFEPVVQTPTNDLTRNPSPFIPPSPPPTATVSTGVAFLTILFPRLPPPSLIAQLLLLFVTIACLLVFILLTGYCIAYMPVDDLDDYIEQQVLQQQ